MRGIKTEKQISEKAPAYDKHVLIYIIYCKMLSSKLENMEKKIKIIDLIFLLF